MISLANTKLIITLAFLVILYSLELTNPFFKNRKNKVSHDTKNISLGILNSIIISLLFATTLFLASSSKFARDHGLINNLSLNPILTIIAIVLLFDLWMYIWHVANHKIRLLWRFHKVHHSDKDLDASSAFRFHTGEIFLSTLGRIIIIMILGLSINHILIYEIILLPVILFHHSNTNFPEKYDKYYRLIFASPHMHWIHHSDIKEETDSNYGSIFSFWDRFFKTFRLRKDYQNINQGLKEYTDKKFNTFFGMLKTPFLRIR